MRFVIVTGMSGAGKSSALKMLEDAGYFCVDNLPIPLVDKFAELAQTSSQEYNKVALGLDVRSIHDSSDIQELLDTLAANGHSMEILYLEANDAALIRRYKETRRSHPLARQGRVDEGISLERDLLAPLKDRADNIIDTSQMITRDLREQINRIFVQSKQASNLFVTVLSFGFKHGLPSDADLVFDVRFLPNPYYIDHLRHKTGNDAEVREYVYGTDAAPTFEKKWFDLIDFLLPGYAAEGKTQLVIAVGCTGGKHRSVTMARKLHEHISAQSTYGVRIEHRDILK